MKRFAKAAILALTACLALGLLGCSSETYEPEGKSPQVTTPTIGQSGVLRVGVNTSNPPLAGESTDIVGIDVDLAAAIADELGLKLEVSNVGSGALSALNAGTVDIVLGIDSSNTDSTMWKSDSYLTTSVALFSTSENAAVPTKDSGALISAQTSSMSAWAVTNEFGQSMLKAESDLSTAFKDLADGTVKYAAADAVIGSWAAHVAGIDTYIVAIMQQPTGYSIGALASNNDLTKVISDTLKTLTKTGIVGVIQAKWLGREINFSSVPYTAGATTAS